MSREAPRHHSEWLHGRPGVIKPMLTSNVENVSSFRLVQIATGWLTFYKRFFALGPNASSVTQRPLGIFLCEIQNYFSYSI